MPSAVKILCFAGTTREAAFNKKFARLAARLAAQDGAAATFLDLRDYPLPLYDGDFELEHGLPDNARTLKTMLKNHHGIVLSCGEYNSSITGVLKNMIDWTSRSEGSEAAKAAWANKVGLLLAASPSAFGGLRAMIHVREILTHMGVLMLSELQALPKANEAFAEDGSLKDPATQARLQRHLQTLIDTCTRLQR